MRIKLVNSLRMVRDCDSNRNSDYERKAIACWCSPVIDTVRDFLWLFIRESDDFAQSRSAELQNDLWKNNCWSGHTIWAHRRKRPAPSFVTLWLKGSPRLSRSVSLIAAASFFLLLSVLISFFKTWSSLLEDITSVIESHSCDKSSSANSSLLNFTCLDFAGTTKIVYNSWSAFFFFPSLHRQDAWLIHHIILQPRGTCRLNVTIWFISKRRLLKFLKRW